MFLQSRCWELSLYHLLATARPDKRASWFLIQFSVSMFGPTMKLPRVRVGQLWPFGQNWPATCFCKVYKLKIVFTFLNGCKKKKKKSKDQQYFMTWKIYEILISNSINKVLLEHGHVHSFLYHLYCLWLLLH